MGIRTWHEPIIYKVHHALHISRKADLHILIRFHYLYVGYDTDEGEYIFEKKTSRKNI